jgi:hypothetical protein
MTQHLNGWQRLWVLLSVIWLIIVGSYASIMMPRASDYATARLHDTIDAVCKHLDSENPSDLKGDEALHLSVFKFRCSLRKYGDWHEDENELRSTYKDIVDFAPVDRTYRHRMDGLRTEQLRAVGISLLAWLTPSLVVYVLGYGIGWVVNGFRQSAKKE